MNAKQSVFYRTFLKNQSTEIYIYIYIIGACLYSQINLTITLKLYLLQSIIHNYLKLYFRR